MKRDSLRPAGPIHVADRFRPLHEELIALLHTLRPEDWARPTSAGAWRVRDVVAHLLDGDLRRLSIARDEHRPPVDRPIGNYADLLGFLDALNAEWVAAARRISPALLIDLLAYVGPQLASFLASLDPFAPAPLGVAWAGQQVSPNWLDVGREYTERWHHQDQIREAVGAPALTAAEWLRPVLEISLWALPHAYRSVPGEEAADVRIDTTGAVRATWSLVRRDGRWQLFSGSTERPACRITLDAETAARLLLHRLHDSMRTRLEVEGEARLARPFLGARAVMV